MRVADKEGFVMRNKWCVILTLSSMLLLAGIVSACVTKTPTPTVMPPEVTLTPTSTATPTAKPTSTHTPPPPTNTPITTPTPTVPEEFVKIHEECMREGENRRNDQDVPYEYLMYKEQQIVVTGRQGDIDDAIGILESLDMELALKKGFLLGDQGTAMGDRTWIQLYQAIDGGRAWVEQVTCIINTLRELDYIGVSADPNYHISPAQWAGGGSPWTQNGQWAQGLPGGGLGQVLEDVPGGIFQSFLTQWAFGPNGIELFQGEQRTVAYMGEGVRIGVFDSSPFTDWEGELILPPGAVLKGETETGELKIPLSSTKTITVTEFTVPFQLLMEDYTKSFGGAEYLTVWHTEPISAPNCPGGKLEYWDFSNHGLFVAGLAHAVAPASEIYLVRALENDGCADLYSIAEGIKGFVQKMQKDGDPVVINLSLGVHEPPDPEGLGLPKAIESFQQVIDDVRKDGAVVVAAAGNDSYDKKVPNEMEIPASEPGVVGVAASNVDRERGCFSNRGNVAAPGGNGIGRCEVPGRDPEESYKYVCQESSSYCLVGPIYKPCGPGYAYWVGTSFATPLVSGQAALLLGKGVAPGDVMSIIWSTADSVIIVKVEDGQELEIPIINVPNSLQ
jgi:subtilisin family serine protease